MSRWDVLTEQERQDVHHALRVLLTHPIKFSDEDAARITAMADELWSEHSARVEKRFAEMK